MEWGIVKLAGWYNMELSQSKVCPPLLISAIYCCSVYIWLLYWLYSTAYLSLHSPRMFKRWDGPQVSTPSLLPILTCPLALGDNLSFRPPPSYLMCINIAPCGGSVQVSHNLHLPSPGDPLHVLTSVSGPILLLLLPPMPGMDINIFLMFPMLSNYPTFHGKSFSPSPLSDPLLTAQYRC